MKRYIFAAGTLVFVLCGCECFLPSGTPPEGAIVHNQPQTIQETVMEYRKAVDFFISELIRETMIHCDGKKIFIDADHSSARAADFIFQRAGELSGVTRSLVPADSVRLVSRFGADKVWQMKLLSCSGKELWSRSVGIKP